MDRILSLRLLVAISFLLLGACRIVLETEGGGYVLGPDGEILCQEWRTCPILTDPDQDYSNVFRADPFEGYRFVGWKKGNGYLCGGKTGDCIVNVPQSLTGRVGIIRLSPQFETAGWADLYVNVEGLEGDLYIRQHFLTNWDSFRRTGRYWYDEYAIGSTYSLEIDRQPDHQQCTILNGQGTISSEEDVEISVICSRADGRPLVPNSRSLYKKFNKVASYNLDVSDPDGDPLTINWELVRTLGGGDLTYQASNGGRDLTLTGSKLGYYLLQATVSDGSYQVKHFLRVVVENDLPILSGVYIPENVTADQDIQVNYYVGEDPEGEPVTVSFDWAINDVIQKHIEGDVLPAGTAKVGDRVLVTVRASDGIKENWRVTREVIVADTPP